MSMKIWRLLFVLMVAVVALSKADEDDLWADEDLQTDTGGDEVTEVVVEQEIPEEVPEVIPQEVPEEVEQKTEEEEEEEEEAEEKVDFSKLRVKELKKRLAEAGDTYCLGLCNEKSEFVKRLNAITEDPSVIKRKTLKVKTVRDSLEGTTENFEELVLKADIPVIVDFFAPWCGHCKALAPLWASAAKKLEGKVRMVDIDCTVHTEIATKYAIGSYPTIKIFRVGATEPEEYEGGRTLESLVDLGLSLVGEALPKVTSDTLSVQSSELSAILSAQENAQSLVLFTQAAGSREDKKAVKTMVKTADRKMRSDVEWPCSLFIVECTDDCDVTEFPAFRYFVDGEFVSTFDLAPTGLNLMSFAKKPSLEAAQEPDPEAWEVEGEEAVTHLKPANFRKYLKENPNALVFFYAPWCAACTGAKPDIIEASQELIEMGDEAPGALATLDCQLFKKFCSKIKVGQFPTYRHYLNGEFNIEYTNKRSAKHLIEFLEDPNGSLSEPDVAPFLDDEEEGPSVVEILNRNNFKTYTTELPSVLVMFYAPWCGHCKTSKPLYSKVAQHFVDEGDEHRLAAVDCTVEEKLCRDQGVTSFPTMIYYHEGTTIEYNRNRDETSLKSFMISYGKANGEEEPEPVAEDEEEEEDVDENDEPFNLEDLELGEHDEL